MAYTKFQFIALETPTIDPVTPDKMWSKDKDYVDNCIKDLSENDKKAVPKLGADAKSRLNWIRGAVDEALSSEHVKNDDVETLKLFVAPEFFFRPDLTANQLEAQKNKAPGVPNRAYSFADTQAIEFFLERLFRSDKLKDWLIIPGTVLGYMEAGNKARTPNRAYVIKGGPPAKDKTAILSRHAKINTPDTDGIPKLKIWPVMPANAPKQKTALAEYQASTLGESASNIIAVDGFQIGIDLCMDHGSGILYRTCKLLDKKQLLLQFVVACGHAIKSQSLATADGGFVMLVEGARLDNHSQVLKVTKVDWDDPDGSNHEPDLLKSKQYLESNASTRNPQPTIAFQKNKGAYDEILRIYKVEPLPGA